MDDVTKTDKMLSRKDGRVGYLIFNNPERHNAVSLDMWAATSRILEGFARDDEVRVVVPEHRVKTARLSLLMDFRDAVSRFGDPSVFAQKQA